MRTWVYNAVKSCPGQVDFSGDRVFSPGAVDAPDADSPERPFIVIRFAPNQPPLNRLPGARIRQQSFQVYLHIIPGSMLVMDDLLEELQEWLPFQAPADDGGSHIMACEWDDTSSDGWDDHFNTVTRYAAFTVTYRGPIP